MGRTPHIDIATSRSAGDQTGDKRTDPPATKQQEKNPRRPVHQTTPKNKGPESLDPGTPQAPDVRFANAPSAGPPIDPSGVADGGPSPVSSDPSSRHLQHSLQGDEFSWAVADPYPGSALSGIPGSGPEGEDPKEGTKALLDPLRVAVISVAFSHPSTTFAGSDVRALRQMGTQVSVHDMLFPHKNREANLQERGLDGLDYTTLSWRSAYRGLIAGLRRPTTTMRFLKWVVRHTYRKPGLMARCLALTPRSLEIADRIRRERPDVVHLFWGETPSLVGRLVRWELPETKLSMFLGAYDLVDLHPYSPEVANDSDVVFTHCRANLPRLQQVGVPSQRVKVAPRGIPIPRLPPIKRVRNRIVTAGRLIPTKNMDEAMAVFAMVKRHVQDATFVILGDGPEVKPLKELARSLDIEDAVEFKGHVTRMEVFEELARAEAFLLMTHHPSERLPNVVKEAMAVGCVPVVTRTPGIEELIKDRREGFIVPTGDLAGASMTLRDLLDDPSLRERMETAARRRIRRDFDVRVAMGTYLHEWRRRPPRRRAMGEAA
jgi:colanic acid/amylovoran biosynthesis glycosyltransferase